MVAPVRLVLEAPLAVPPLARDLHLAHQRRLHLAAGLVVAYLPGRGVGHRARRGDHGPDVAGQQQQDQGLRHHQLPLAAASLLLHAELPGHVHLQQRQQVQARVDGPYGADDHADEQGRQHVRELQLRRPPEARGVEPRHRGPAGAGVPLLVAPADPELVQDTRAAAAAGGVTGHRRPGRQRGHRRRRWRLRSLLRCGPLASSRRRRRSTRRSSS
mmetsp:Transcript_50753/g.162426  ORF Transcript_50753/g.162426 Transcript_50753/m.162426 type:complete len:215 (+) Transcript_50753:784-1428(+)